jgi:hypothetical protein
MRLSDNSKRWVQALEACERIVRTGVLADEIVSPPMGSFGLPVMNWR